MGQKRGKARKEKRVFHLLNIQLERAPKPPLTTQKHTIHTFPLTETTLLPQLSPSPPPPPPEPTLFTSLSCTYRTPVLAREALTLSSIPAVPKSRVRGQ